MVSATPRDPQPVSENSKGAASLPGSASFSGSLGEVVDWLVENDRHISGLMAQRALLLEEARTRSESAVAHSSSSGAHGGWNSHVVARRELISSVACALRLPERTAENLIGTSRVLVNDLSATHAALAAGAINLRQAETIVDHATSLPAESMADFETAVLAIAPNLTNGQLDRRAGRIRERMHPDSIDGRHTSAVDRRCVDLTPARDGMAWLSAHLPATTATAAYNRITDLALNVEGEGVGSTLTQLRADVFADLLVDGFTYDLAAEHAEPAEYPGHLEAVEHLAVQAGHRGHARQSGQTRSASTARPVRSIRSGLGRGVRATVHVTVPVMTLLGHSVEPAELEGYGPIDDATARKLAAGAPSFHRILTHPETGAVLSVGRDSYSVPKDLRRWLTTRDETCRFPGCGRSARRCEVDHSVDWQFNGTTVHDNLAHLCARHHHLKHQTGWSYTQHAGGRLEWVSPTGHRYATEPAVHFRNEAVDPDWAAQNRASLDEVRATAGRGYDYSDPDTIDRAERFIPHPDDPPDADPDDPWYFVIREAS